MYKKTISNHSISYIKNK